MIHFITYTNRKIRISNETAILHNTDLIINNLIKMLNVTIIVKHFS